MGRILLLLFKGIEGFMRSNLTFLAFFGMKNIIPKLSHFEIVWPMTGTEGLKFKASNG